MSGSGPTVIGVAPSSAAARQIRSALAGRPWQMWVTRTVTEPALTVSPDRRVGMTA
jgi:4-diphosphocytidyl-2C-methyl-D-erythritol kinase